MKYVWVIYQNDGEGIEWFVTRYRWLCQMMFWFAPKHHTIEWYRLETYKSYKGIIWGGR